MDLTEPSTSRTQPDLSVILEAERELVVKTQENYRILKQKYLECKEELELSSKELSILREEREVDRNSREQLAALSEKSQQLLLQLEEDNRIRQIAHEEFKTNTLSEVQRVFRKELADKAKDMDLIAIEKDELIAENDRLIEESRELRAELSRQMRESRQREHQLATDFAVQAEELITTCCAESYKRKDETESEVVTMLKNRIISLEQKLAESQVKSIDDGLEQKDIIRKLELELEEEKHQVLQLKIANERHVNEVIVARQATDLRQKEIDKIAEQLRKIREDKLQIELNEMDNNQKTTEMLNEHCERFQIQIQQWEKLLKDKEKRIQNLQEKLDDSLEIEAQLETTKNELLFEQQEKLRMEKECQSLLKDFDRQERAHSKKISKLELERTRLEDSIESLQFQLATSPDTVAEATRLRKNVAQLSDELKATKEHYRQLLKKMKHALTHLEKRHQKAQKKLDESIVI